MPLFFPITFLALLAHTLLRLFLGIIFVYLGVRHLGSSRTGLTTTLSTYWPRIAVFSVWWLGIWEIILGGMMILGLWSQIAALILIGMSIKMIVLSKYFADPSIPGRIFYVLVIGVALSLFVTGPGVPALDYPF